MQVIVWIGTENLKPGDVLNDINDYLNGLDNIIMDGGSKNGVREKMCDKPNYGHFVVTINKMMGDASDEELFKELMTPEPDYIDGAEERNEIRHKLLDCFDGISVRGLPVLNIESGQEIDYSVLDQRFKSSLAAMANTIIEKAKYPRSVSVGGVALELNSTTAEVIISTVIEEANKGEIDLTGFEAFWKYITWKAENEIYQSEKSLEISLPLCQKYKSFSCSSCACSQRNDVIADTIDMIDEIFLMALNQALEMFNEDVTNRVNEIYETVINPWAAENSCTNQLKQSFQRQSGYCDFSQMMDDFIKPSEEIHVSCEYAFVCDEVTFDGSNITLDIDNIYFSKSTELNILAPLKAKNGISGKNEGEDGTNGEDGAKGANIQINAAMELKGSTQTFLITLRGGDGGDGGDGAMGLKGENGINGQNGMNGAKGKTGATGHDETDPDPDGGIFYITNADQVVNHPEKSEIDYGDSDHDFHCCTDHCHEKREWHLYKVTLTASVSGGSGSRGGNGENGKNGGHGGNGEKGSKGGNGGNGGNGGQSGSVLIAPGVSFDPIINKLGGQGGQKGRGGNGGPGGDGGLGGNGGKGGLGGDGGRGGMGISQTKEYFGKKNYFSGDCGCDWSLLVCDCDCDGSDRWNDSFRVDEDPELECCPGDSGPEGQPGANGSNGAPGSTGQQGEPGQDGNDGVPA